MYLRICKRASCGVLHVVPVLCVYCKELAVGLEAVEIGCVDGWKTVCFHGGEWWVFGYSSIASRDHSHEFFLTL